MTVILDISIDAILQKEKKNTTQKIREFKPQFALNQELRFNPEYIRGRILLLMA